MAEVLLNDHSFRRVLVGEVPFLRVSFLSDAIGKAIGWVVRTQWRLT